jgi:hypothetical protein
MFNLFGKNYGKSLKQMMYELNEMMDETLNYDLHSTTESSLEDKVKKEEVKTEDGEWIKIFFGSNDYFGRIPPRISYYMEELAKMISDELGCHVEFGFGKNGDCSTVYFTTAAKLDAKIARVRSALRFDR